MVRLISTYETKRDALGFTNRLHVECNYDHEQGSLDSIKVSVWSERLMSVTDITGIFEATPFVEVVDSIDWHELYRDKMEQLAEAKMEVADA